MQSYRDAPARTTASLGIAMGAIGNDVAIESANIALMTMIWLKLRGLYNIQNGHWELLRKIQRFHF